FVLPLCTPVGPIADRLLGWVIALVVCVPAALFLFPPRHHDELRRTAARVCRVLAYRLEGSASARDVNRAMNELYESFLGADYRPVALTAGSRALVRVVDDLGWISDRVTDSTGEILGEMRDPVVRVLRDSAALLRIHDPARRAERSADLRAALEELRTV
ncbi:FUSC family protein, partial [Nonomuraea aridisoli]